MSENTVKYLDYEGLKQVVKNILDEIPQADGKTIVKNSDGTFSARVNYIPEVSPGTGTLVFDSSPTYVVNSTETLVYQSNT